MHDAEVVMPPIRKQKVLCLGGVAARDPMLGALRRWLDPAPGSLADATQEELRTLCWDAVLLDADGHHWREDLATLVAVAPDTPVLILHQGPEPSDKTRYRRGATWVGRQPDESDHDFTARVAIQVESCLLDGALGRGDSALSQLIDQTPYGIAIFSTAGYQVRGNQAFRHLFGAPMPPDMCNWDLPFHSSRQMQEVRAQLMQGKTVWVPPLWMNTKDEDARGVDHPACFSTVAFTLRHRCGAPQYIVTMFEDITARAVAERDLQQTHAALKEAFALLEQRVQERTADLVVANDKLQAQVQKREQLQRMLERKNRELEDFSFRVGHDLKNHLLGIRAMLQGGSDPETVEENSQAVVESSNRLITFVERLLQMARAGRVIGDRVPTDVVPLARAVFHSLTRASGNPGDDTLRTAELCVRGRIPRLRVDPTSMEQVLTNLMGNAVCHRRAAQALRVELSAHPVEHGIELRLRDNGQGLTAEILEHVFEIGYTTDHGAHTGFGLPIVKKIIEAHGGTVRVESDGPGQGACFALAFPSPCLDEPPPT